MNFEKYEAEDFLQEESFLNFCLEVDDRDVRFWNDWMEAHPVKRDTILQAREMYYLLNGNITPGQFRNDAEEFRALVEKQPALKSPDKRVWLYAAAAAACVLLVFGIINKDFFTRKSAPPSSGSFAYRLQTQAGERRTFTLADGSRLWLNGGSCIFVATDFNKHTREITLEGEAYFDVAHQSDRPFIIHTRSMDVKVLGTIFNVKAYPADEVAETALIQGSVEVTLRRGEHQKIVLKPNEKITLTAQAGADETVQDKAVKKAPYRISALKYSKKDSTSNEAGWIKNRLVFDNDAFSGIAAQLERWYGVKIIFESDKVKEYRYTATFDGKNIQEVLNAIQLSRHFNYRAEKNNTIYISE